MSRKAQLVQRLDYGLDHRGIEVRFRQEDKKTFFLFPGPKSILGKTQPPILFVVGIIEPGC
jgi:hypothetical protein